MNEGTQFPHPFSTPDELISRLKRGEIIILVDDEDRENEGDLVTSAQFISNDKINFMAKEGRGLICIAMDSEQTRKLNLHPIRDLAKNFGYKFLDRSTAFTFSIEAADGVTTGISASDRAQTIRVASNPEACPQDIRVPGHVFPIRAEDGGVLKRAGHTEASVDLMKMAQLWPSAVICEIMKDNGEMARLPDLLKYSAKFNLAIGTIADIIEYRLKRETLVEEVENPSDTFSPLVDGWSLRIFKDNLGKRKHHAFVKTVSTASDIWLVRIETGEQVTFGLDWIKNKESRIDRSFQMIQKYEGPGLFLFLNLTEDKENDLNQIVKRSSHPSQMDPRNYGIGAQIMKMCGITRFKLISNSRDRRAALKGFNLEMLEVVPFK